MEPSGTRCCIDRLYLNGYVPRLQSGGGVVDFLVRACGQKIASPAVFGQLTTTLRPLSASGRISSISPGRVSQGRTHRHRGSTLSRAICRTQWRRADRCGARAHVGLVGDQGAGQPRVTAVLNGLCHFLWTADGLTNAQLRPLIASLLGTSYTTRQMGSDLRRLRRKELLTRLKGQKRYVLSLYGRRAALFLTKVHARILRPGFQALDLSFTAQAPPPLRTTFAALDRAIDAHINRPGESRARRGRPLPRDASLRCAVYPPSQRPPRIQRPHA